jgi:aspartate 1-decarboxylase
MFKSKIHRATVTEANVDYEGSITIDSELMRAADILPGEQVHVVNVDNGERLVTYAIAGAAGQIHLNGAAAHKGKPGDRIIIISYGNFSSDELARFKPTVVKVDEKNGVLEPALA